MIEYIPISKNRETQRQVNAILALEIIRKEFESMDDKSKTKFLKLLYE